MAKFYGKVGYVQTEKTSPGVWTPQVTERDYYGDLIRNNSRWQENQQVNHDMALQNEISILADPYALQNFQYIRYVELSQLMDRYKDPDYGNKVGYGLAGYMVTESGKIRPINRSLWSVTGVRVEYPRLILSIGGVYNGEQANPAG